MNVLLLAPQPFYSERGTPMSEENLVRVMSARGWTIDLLTYAEGHDVDLPGLTIHRIPSIPGVRQVPPGFSGRKLISDIAMIVEACRLSRIGDYDLVHGLEEAVFIAALIGKLYGVPYVYDMDSILSEQLIDRYPGLHHARGALRYFEEIAVGGSLAVIAVCDSLSNSARTLSDDAFVAQLEDRTQLGPLVAGDESLADIVGEDRQVVVYAGNLERYQGIDLLLAGFAQAVREEPSLALVLIGGSASDVERYRDRASELGVAGSAHVVGPRPVPHLRHYLEQADMLVSPRIAGTNTPMKIYSFLDAGVPLLATRLKTHLQVLDDEIARLFEPTPAGLSAALVELARDPSRRSRLAAAAARRVRERYSTEAYERKAHRILAELEARVARGEIRARGRTWITDRASASVTSPAGIHGSGTTSRSAAGPRPAPPAARMPAPFSLG